MKYYRPDSQKSSNLTESYFNQRYGLSRSVAAQAIIHGMAAHIRIYEAALRLGMETMIFSATDLIAWLAVHNIIISMATAQRVLVDTDLFVRVSQRKTGKRGRPINLYEMVSSRQLSEKLLVPIAADWNAPELTPTDLSSAMHYTLAILGRAMCKMDNSTRQQQIEFWGWSKPTMIRRTRKVCDIIPQYKRISSDSLNFTAPINGDDVFLWEVRERENTRSRRYWLEIVNGAGEICKLPCRTEIAARWLPKSVVVLCEQLPNRYLPHAPYRDTPPWEGGGGSLPY